MYAIALIRYRRPLEEVETVTVEHRAYLRRLFEEGTLLVAGPLSPRTGGALLLRVSDEDFAEALDRVRDGDPYVIRGMAQYEILPWSPITGAEKLAAL